MLIWGAKSQARIYRDMLLAQGNPPRFIFDPFGNEPAFGNECKLLDGFESLSGEIADIGKFVVAIGDHHGLARHQTILWLLSQGVAAHDLISPSAVVEPSVRLGTASAVMAGAVIHHFVETGDGCILNTGCIIDHETVLGHGVHVMRGASIAGRVRIGDYASIGTNATVLPDITIGRGAYVGAGAVVTRDVEPGCVVMGAPARPTRQNQLLEAAFPTDFRGREQT